MSKTDLPSRSWVNCIYINPVNLQNLGTLGVEQFPGRTSNNFSLKALWIKDATTHLKIDQMYQTTFHTLAIGASRLSYT